MELESESDLLFFRETLRKEKAAGIASLWDLYQEFNHIHIIDELINERIRNRKALTERGKERLALLRQAEQDGVLVMKL